MLSVSFFIMNVVSEFGFVTGCHAGDKFMVGATLASIRHYCPNTPICLTVDGDFDVSDLERNYGVITLRISELPSPEMQKTLGRSYHAKLAAMWEGPFSHYVWLDADAIVWGDFRSQIRLDLDFQIFWSDISIASDAKEIPDWLPHFYFDPGKLIFHDPDFNWRGLPYFCAGCFAVKRNLIDFQDYCRLKIIADTEPGAFAWGDMGMLNYWVHSNAQAGKIKIGMSDLQHIPEHHGRQELVDDCVGAGWYFPNAIRRPRIAHFCGRKPFLIDHKAYSKPYTIARLEHHRRYRSNFGVWLSVLNEERSILFSKIKRRVKFF
jgi:hypothetical protein